MRQAFILSALLCTLAWFTGCVSEDTFKHPAPAALSGEWVNAGNGNALQFQDNNRFSLVVEGETPRRLTGWAYYPQSNHVSLQFDSRLAICPDVTGVYLYERDGDKLSLTPVRESCEERKEMVGGSWEQKDSSWF
ncbi:hypothetical protein H5P28_19065 [Ruficoccus amylovorans]|uniref:Lipoprotein n=1 Tax=Ruficoccus amylovorans TaxID=1804625 RepID=A0A842HL14_9BACT|nr:hypothetical protein [Ruficoccus amylovorans]MBC2596374.1 hypothetical protein [Ruficoccus amylovorans]